MVFEPAACPGLQVILSPTLPLEWPGIIWGGGCCFFLFFHKTFPIIKTVVVVKAFKLSGRNKRMWVDLATTLYT